MSREVVDALWSPMLKYPKNQATMEPDTTRPPTLKLKLPSWEGAFKFELFDTQNNILIPNEDGVTPSSFGIRMLFCVSNSSNLNCPPHAGSLSLRVGGRVVSGSIVA